MREDCHGHSKDSGVSAYLMNFNPFFQLNFKEQEREKNSENAVNDAPP